MSTIDQSGAIHDAKGRFAGHVAAESTTGLCAELIHDEPQPILTAMPEIEELQRQRDEICRTIDEAKWRAIAAQVKHDYPTAESITVSFDREDRIYHLDAVLAADEQPLYNSLDFDAVSDETLDIALVGGDARLDAVGARDYPGQTLFGGGQVLPLDRLATIGRSQDSDPPELPDFRSTDDALNERVLSILHGPGQRFESFEDAHPSVWSRQVQQVGRSMAGDSENVVGYNAQLVIERDGDSGMTIGAVRGHQWSTRYVQHDWLTNDESAESYDAVTEIQQKLHEVFRQELEGMDRHDHQQGA